MKTLKLILLFCTIIIWVGFILSIFQPVRTVYADFVSKVKIYSIEAGLDLPVTFGTSGNGIDIESPIGAVNGVQVEIVDPAPTVAGNVPASLEELGAGFPALPITGSLTSAGSVTVAAAPAVPICDWSCITCCVTMDENEQDLALAASADDLFLVSNYGAAVSILTGAAPDATWGTNVVMSDQFAAYLTLADAVVSGDTAVGTTSLFCAIPCVRQ